MKVKLVFEDGKDATADILNISENTKKIITVHIPLFEPEVDYVKYVDSYLSNFTKALNDIGLRNYVVVPVSENLGTIQVIELENDKNK